MRIINVVPEMDQLQMGKQGENKSTKFLFDVSDWLEKYPGCTITLVNRRPNENSSYPCVLTTEEDGKRGWVINSADLAIDGKGECELKCTLGDMIEKDKRTWKTTIKKSLSGEGDAPEPWESVMDDIEALVGDAQDAAADAEDEAENSEAYAVGKRGGEDVGSTDPAYHNNSKYYAEQAAALLDTKADKVSGATNGNLAGLDSNGNLMDSGKKPADFYELPGTGIPESDLSSGVQSSLELADSAYQKPSGGIPSTDMASSVMASLSKADTAYQKPSGGIPSTDMATAVQTSLGKADTAYQKDSGGIPSTDMTAAVQTSIGKADTAYQKPSGGIPSTDMATAVQTSLGKADSAYQKPGTGIPASDMASGVIPVLTDLIDDTAGEGDDDLTWSADKLAAEKSALTTQINSKADASDVAELENEIGNKADEPTGTKSTGKVYGLDGNLNPAWVEKDTDPSVIAEATAEWLDDHPEATTTVEDGSITKAKLNNSLVAEIDGKASAILSTDELKESHGSIGTFAKSIKIIPYENDPVNSFGSGYVLGNNAYSILPTKTTNGITFTKVSTGSLMKMTGTATGQKVYEYDGFSAIDPNVTFDANDTCTVFAISNVTNLIVNLMYYHDGWTIEYFTSTNGLRILEANTLYRYTSTVQYKPSLFRAQVLAYTSDREFGENDYIWIGLFKGNVDIQTALKNVSINLPSDATGVDSLWYNSQVSFRTDTKEYIDTAIENAEIEIGSELSYVTPEWFYGDKIPSNVDAYSYINQAIAYGIAHNLPVYCFGDYTISQMLTLQATFADLYINSIKYTGADDFALRICGRYNKVRINKLSSTNAGGVQLYGLSTTDHYSNSNNVYIGYALCYKDVLAFGKADGVSFDVGFNSYNRIEIMNGISTTGSIINMAEGTGAAENIVYGGDVKTLADYAIKINAGGSNKFYNFSLEDDVYSGIRIGSSGDNKFIRIRTRECEDACDKDQNRTFMKITGYSRGNEFIDCNVSPYSIDVSDITTPPETYITVPDSGPMYWFYVKTPVIRSDNNFGKLATYYYSPSKYWIEIGDWAINCDGDVICKPFTPFELEVSDSAIDAGTKQFADRFKILADSTITVPKSYCSYGIQSFVVDQTHGYTCTIVDEDGNTIFDGDDYGDGLYRVSFHAYKVAYEPSTGTTMYTLYYGKSNAYVEKLTEAN